MFCKKCGSELPENVRFCPKCGAATGQSPATGQAPRPSPGSGQGWRLLLSSPKVWVAGGAIAVLLFAVGLGIGLSRNGESSRSERDAAGEEGSVREEQPKQAEPYNPSNQEEQDRDITSLSVSSAVTLEGEYENLRSVTVSPGADGSVSAITYLESASFPSLESLECGAVLKVTDTGDRGYFEETDFPKLKSVTMKLVNRYIDEDTLMTFLLFQEMYDAGRLQSFRLENSCTVEDLYGTWADDRQTLTLTFEKDGTLRVADANNLIGVDVLQYRESGDNTLSLSANQSGLLGMISIQMKYVLLGDWLQVELSGQEFTLTRR